MKKTIIVFFFFLTAININAQEYTLGIFSEYGKTSLKVLQAKWLEKEKTGDFGYGIGVNNYIEFNKITIGSGLKYKRINYTYWMERNFFETFSYIDVSIFVEKDIKFFFLQFGIDNNFFIKTNTGLIDNSIIFTADSEKIPKYTIGTNITLGINIKKRIKLGITGFTDISPNYKLYYTPYNSGPYLYKIGLSNGIMLNLEYKIFKHKSKNNE